MNGIFFEQLSSVAGVFDQWGPCEKTIVACALARRVPWPGLKLVHRAVEAALQNHVMQEDERLEHEANDEAILTGLLAVRCEDDDNEGADQLRRLLMLLPFLRTDNERAKDVFVAGAQTLVQRCVDAPRRATTSPDLCRQLLSYLLVHPALTHNDQKTLTQWLRHLENHISGNRTTETVWQQRIDPCLFSDSNIWGVSNTFRRTIGKNVEFRSLVEPIETCYIDILQESFSKNGRDVDISLEGEKLNFDITITQPKSERSNSLTPPTTNFMHMSSSAENLSDEPFVQKPRSFSLSSEHSLSQLRPISIMYGTTGSETRLDDLRSHNFGEHPGMSTVTQWLKSLRLHKYVWLFTNISYDQMIAMDDKYLEELGVTKGARHKLLLSIKKLSERSAILESIESELTSNVTPVSLARALEKLRGVLLSPMPPASELPQHIVRVLDIASTALSSGSNSTRLPTSATEDDHEPPVDPLSLHCWLIEKALHHEAFTQPELVEQLKRLRHRLPPRQFFHHVSDMPLNRRCPKPRWRLGPNGYQKVVQRRSWAPQYSVAPPAPRGKSNSYPPFPPAAAPRPPPAASAALSDEYSSLDALCLQMTEQAIN
ncbi:protein Smaug [Amyelois transitella]|uniref:protein Smaug n=1 Tax=Amyelois transitella TaxID=680683 RepID=UPI00067CA11B|nr:protein Smaug [Amyelois transitella]